MLLNISRTLHFFSIIGHIPFHNHLIVTIPYIIPFTFVQPNNHLSGNLQEMSYAGNPKKCNLFCKVAFAY